MNCITVPLYRAAHGRTGDKGDRSNISVIAWHPALYPLIVEQVTEAVVLQRFAHRRPSGVTRHLLPDLHAAFPPAMQERFAEVPRGKPVAVVCGSGSRASIAASLLQPEGHEGVRNIRGGTTAWKDAGPPTTSAVARSAR